MRHDLLMPVQLREPVRQLAQGNEPRAVDVSDGVLVRIAHVEHQQVGVATPLFAQLLCGDLRPDRKSTRLNSSHSQISYAVFCLKKKKNNYTHLIDSYG